jgi:hypothetical protein
MPVSDTYGPWPENGDIDITESRGEGIILTILWEELIHFQARCTVVLISHRDAQLTLGPDQTLDRWWMTHNTHRITIQRWLQAFPHTDWNGDKVSQLKRYFGLTMDRLAVNLHRQPVSVSSSRPIHQTSLDDG